MKATMLQAHLDVAARYAKLSPARRLRVGAIVVKDDRIISIGYNGTPTGWNNNCEDRIDAPAELTDTRELQRQGFNCGDSQGYYKLVTRPEVIHAEENAIAKLARSTESGLGASMFVTHAPCLTCAKLILQSGIIAVYYRHEYRTTEGLDFLRQGGVQVQQLP